MYVVRSSDEVDEQIAELPADALPALAELRAALELNPWSGDPWVRRTPEAPMRSHVFSSASGDGFVVYTVSERDRLVDLLQIIWLG